MVISIVLFLLFEGSDSLANAHATLNSRYGIEHQVIQAAAPEETPSKSRMERDSTKTTDLGIKWILVEGGKFRMGNDNGLAPDESPEHDVILDSFFISATEVTFEQFDRFCEATRRKKPADNGWSRGAMPVINVNLNDAAEYCKWATEGTGMIIRLPTEAEWEFAARGGKKSRGFSFSGGNQVDQAGWYSENSERKTHPVGSKQANELGVYDMTGNVWEWCSDWYSDEYYSQSPTKNPRGPASGQFHVLRGGSWISTEEYCHITTRSSLRSDYVSVNNGFRVVREANAR